MRSARICLGFGLLACFLAAVPAAFAQYPTQSQVSKDGTAVMLEDYANPPLSNATHSGANSSAIDYKLQLGRVTSMRAEPANAPLAASRIFVNDQSGTLYILDTATKKFTPYHQIHGYFPEIRFRQGQRHRNCFHHLRSSLRKKWKILYRAHGESRIARIRDAGQHAALQFESHRLHHDRSGESARGPGPSRVGPGGMDGYQHSQRHFRGHRARTLARRIRPQSPHGRYDLRSAGQARQQRLRQSLHRRGRRRSGRNAGPLAHHSAAAQYSARENLADHSGHQFASEGHAQSQRPLPHSLHRAGPESILECVGRAP